MAYGIQNLRRSAIFDQLTPGSGGSTSDVDNRGSYSYSDDDQQPSQSSSYDPKNPSASSDEYYDPKSPTSGLAKIADISVNPNKGRDVDGEQERLRQYIDTVKGSYTPDYHSRDRNDALLDNAPTRNQPTKMDRFTAMALSMGQPNVAETQEKILQNEYYQGMDEFKAKSEPFYKAADLEQRQNSNERQMITGAANTFTQGERIDQTRRSSDQRYEVALINANAKKAASEGYNFINVRPDGVWARNNQGQEKYLGPSGKLTDAEKINLEGEIKRDVAEIGANSRVTVAGIRGPSSSGRGNVSSQIYIDDSGTNFRTAPGGGYVDMENQPYTPHGDIEKIGTDRDPVDTAAARATDLKLKMGEVYATPRGRKWLVPQNDGSYRPKARPTPGRFFDNSADIAEYDAVMKSIWPNYTPDADTAAPPTPTPPVARPGLGPSREPVSPQGNGSNLPSGPIVPGGPGGGTLRARAADELRKRGKRVTQQTIDEVIRRGLVK